VDEKVGGKVLDFYVRLLYAGIRLRFLVNSMSYNKIHSTSSTDYVILISHLTTDKYPPEKYYWFSNERGCTGCIVECIILGDPFYVRHSISEYRFGKILNNNILSCYKTTFIWKKITFLHIFLLL